MHDYTQAKLIHKQLESLQSKEQHKWQKTRSERINKKLQNLQKKHNAELQAQTQKYNTDHANLKRLYAKDMEKLLKRFQHL